MRTVMMMSNSNNNKNNNNNKHNSTGTSTTKSRTSSSVQKCGRRRRRRRFFFFSIGSFVLILLLVVVQICLQSNFSANSVVHNYSHHDVHLRSVLVVEEEEEEEEIENEGTTSSSVGVVMPSSSIVLHPMYDDASKKNETDRHHNALLNLVVDDEERKNKGNKNASSSLATNHYNHNPPDIITLPRKNDAADMVSSPLSSSSQPYELCFVTSIFASNPKNADKVANVTLLKHLNPTFQFILFTNIIDSSDDEEAPNVWHKVIMKDLQQTLNINRTITQSRYPKFLPWKHTDTLRMCPVIFYMDGFTLPNIDMNNSVNTNTTTNNANRFRHAAQQLKTHDYGLGQYPKNDFTIEKLGKLNVNSRKDTKRNIQQTMNWIQNQTDYKSSASRRRQQQPPHVYLNRYIGIDPHNKKYQQLSQSFWNVYSKEDGTYRDQLLWSYFVDDMYDAKPLNMNDILGNKHDMFVEMKENMGYNSHTYVNRKGQSLY